MTAEFDRQVHTLLERGYPEAAGLPAPEFAARLDPLRAQVDNGTPGARFPAVIVVKSELLPAARAIQLVQRNDETGFSVMDGDDITRFGTIDEMKLPGSAAYLMADVDTGHETRNVTPDDALHAIRRRRRLPLTIDEGIALITHHPEAVAKNGGFSLLGSRCGDRRVTALWISGGRPKLGWCWAGNPHTWLGSASCAARFGAD